MATGLNYQGRDGELRFLDKSQASAGAAGTPWGLKLTFSNMDLTLNYPARPEETLRLDRQRQSSDAHYLVGDETALYDPVDVTFSALLSSQETDAILDFIGVNWAAKETANLGDATNPWNVKGTPAAGLVSTKGRGLTGDGLYGGGRIDAKGSAFQLPTFADKKKQTVVDIEVIWQERDGSNKYGLRLKEVYFEPGRQRIGEAADNVTVTLTGQMYGSAERITSFSRAMNVLTSELF